jgi:hypothetical protein
MKGILSFIIALILLMIVLKPCKQESVNDTTFEILSIGSPPADIHMSIKSSVSENNSQV